MSRLANFLPNAGFVPLNEYEADIMFVEVASNYGTAIYPGDPVIAVTDGSVARTPAGTNQAAATDGITGVCIDVIQYKDANGVLRRNGANGPIFVPANTVWTAHQERTIIQIVKATDNMRFRVKGVTGVASLTAARALRFKNCEHSYATPDPGLGLSGAQLVVSGAATTAFQWRIVEVIEAPSNDPTLANFSLDVVVNKPYGWPVTGQSTTGV